MENKEPLITGAIQTSVKVRHGHHAYEGKQEVVELVFQGYNCSYVQVIDIKTAEDLKKQLEFLL